MYLTIMLFLTRNSSSDPFCFHKISHKAKDYKWVEISTFLEYLRKIIDPFPFLSIIFDKKKKCMSLEIVL